MITASMVRILLIIDIAVMALLALVYLRQRRMSWISYLCWGLVAVGVPILGPFLLITNRPGEWDPDFSIEGDFARLNSWLHRLLPEAPKSSRINRARLRRSRRKA